MILLSLITRQTRVKAVVKDKRTAREAYGNYVKPLAGDISDQRFVNKVLKGVGTIICPDEGFLSSVQSLTGVKHIILLSQGSSASGSLSQEDAAFICVQAIDAVPKSEFTFEVVNGGQEVSDWRECLSSLMLTSEQKLQ